MSLKNDALPSSATFDLIRDALKDDSTRKEMLKSAKTIFAITLKSGDQSGDWFVDLKETGTVGKGLAPEGKRPDVTLILNDNDFAQLTVGKANAQQLFMKGKLKIKGNMMAASKLEPLLKKIQTKAKL